MGGGGASPTKLIPFVLTLYSVGYFRSLHHFLFLDNFELIQDFFLNIVEKGAFSNKCYFKGVTNKGVTYYGAKG